MPTPLQLLIAEDDPVDAELLLLQLRRSGFAPTAQRVDTEEAFVRALNPALDLILSDYQMPQFTGLRALELLKQSGLDRPFILVSGTIGEDIAVEAMKKGATDYLLKDRLARLGQAVAVALHQHRLHGERLTTQAALLESEAQVRRNAEEFRLLFEGNPMPMWLSEHETLRFLAVNDAAIRVYGYSREEFLTMTLKEIHLAEDIPQLMHAGKERPSGVVFAGIWKHRRKGGSLAYVEITYRDMPFQGRPAQLVLAQDITERRQAEMARRESDRRFQELAQAIPEVFWMTDPGKERMLYVSPSYATVWGREVEDLYGNAKAWIEAIHPEDRERIQRAISLKQAIGTYDEEFRIVRPDGSVRWIHDKAFPIRDETGVVLRIAGLATDITDRKQLQEQFLRAQRLEAIGTLASGVAHDLNNMLSPILMAAGLLKMSITDEADRNMLSLIENAAKRGADVISQLLTFSRGSEGKREPVALLPLLREVVHLLKQTFPKNVSINFDVPSNLWVIMAEPSQIHQVFMNLGVNARDAMPEGGRLTISAENCRLPRTVEGSEESYVTIQVKDSGHGIPPEIIDRIFDPFFTTKSGTKGTGLGLSTVIGIVKGQGGFIKVESAPGQGTTFSVTLPAIEATVSQSTDEASVEIAGAGRCVLVVDDEEPIRMAARDLLESHDFRVLTAADGKEALELFIEHKDDIRVVLTDLMMPVKGGLELARALRTLKPDVPTIAWTGLDQAEFRRDCAMVGIVRLLPKPFSPAVLFSALNDVLGCGAQSDADRP